MDFGGNGIPLFCCIHTTFL